MDKTWNRWELVVRSFLGSTKVQFRAVFARDARRFLLGVTQLRSMVYAFSVARKMGPTSFNTVL